MMDQQGKKVTLCSWNINGVRSIFQDPSWSECKTYDQVFEALGSPDFVCLQETKIPRSNVGTELGLVKGYDAYYSFNKGRSGAYSGTAIYVRQPLIPKAAEEGFSGVLSGNFDSRCEDAETGTIANRSSIGGGYSPDCELWTELAFTAQELRELDSEGRCVMLEFEKFVLMNVYAPHESNSERRPFKMRFYSGLQTRINALLRSGKEVILVGDLNVSRTPLDHCDPDRSVRENGLTEFSDHPARKWADQFLAPGGDMVDIYRHFHPNVAGAFTCWNTLINARRANYGTRLDYIIASKRLVPFIESCVLNQDILGSDHCPVTCVFREYISENEETNLVNFRQSLGSAEFSTPPPLCCIFYDELSGRQQTIKNFFTADPKSVTSSSFGALSDSKTERAPGGGTLKRSFTASGIGNAKTIDPKSKAISKSKGKRPSSGQKSLTAFFGTPNSNVRCDNISTETNSTAVDPIQKNSVSNEDSVPGHQPEVSQTNVDELLDDAIRSDAKVCEKSTDAAMKWREMLKPPDTPLCSGHREPCVKFRVNKKGPNQGRHFFLCARPVGRSKSAPTVPDSEAASISKGHKTTRKTITEFRCDYFAWQGSTVGKRPRDATKPKEIKAQKDSKPH